MDFYVIDYDRLSCIKVISALSATVRYLTALSAVKNRTLRTQCGRKWLLAFSDYLLHKKGNKSGKDLK